MKSVMVSMEIGTYTFLIMAIVFYGVGIIISIYLMITTNGLSEREVIAQMKERIIIGYIWENREELVYKDSWQTLPD